MTRSEAERVRATCDSCRFWEQHSPARQYGDCRRLAPRWSSPMSVAFDYWCVEHESVTPPARQPGATHAITREEFLRHPERALEVANHGSLVVVVGANGERRMTISSPVLDDEAADESARVKT